jgi:hypothetical protein
MRRASLYGIAAAVAAMLPLAALAQSPLQPGLELTNRSGSPLTELYLKPSGTARWGENKLDEPVDAGARASLHTPTEANCRYDLRAAWRDGRLEEREQVDLCKRQDVELGGK